MAQAHQRVFAFVLAAVLFVSAVGATAIVVWQVRKDNQALKTSNQQNTTNNTNPAANTNQPQQTQGEQTMLKGTQLSNFTPAGEVTELQVIDLVEGTGQVAAAGDTVTAHYTGAYAVNGEIFESSKDGGSPATFPLAQVIQGWQEGVPGMKVGGTRRLIIPGPLAYGAAPEGYTPGSGARPMGTLVFDIELVSLGQ